MFLPYRPVPLHIHHDSSFLSQSLSSMSPANPPTLLVIYLNPLTSRSYTYSTLLTTTRSFGTLLQTHPTFSLQKGQVLALFAQNCIDTPPITWAAHYAGGVVSPANPAYTVRELVHHLHDSGAKFLFTQKHLLPVALEAASHCARFRRSVSQ